MKRITLLLIAVAVAAALSACQSLGVKVVESSDATATPTLPPIPDDFPAGEYRTAVQGMEYKLTLAESGKFVIERVKDSTQLIAGSYAVIGDRISFMDEAINEDEGVFRCPSPGVYQWSFDGQTMKFTIVDDTCLFGREQFFSGEFVKAP